MPFCGNWELNFYWLKIFFSQIIIIQGLFFCCRKGKKTGLKKFNARHPIEAWVAGIILYRKSKLAQTNWMKIKNVFRQLTNTRNATNFLFGLLFLPCFAYAQDAHFSQFYANRVYLNPAYAGFDEGTTVTLNYRNQWFGVPDGDLSTFSDSYRTFNATADIQLPCLLDLEDVNVGTALTVFKDEAGEAPLATTGVGLAFSYEQPLIKALSGSKKGSSLRRLDIRVGAMMGYMQKELEGNHFVYSDQLDPVAGLLEGPVNLGLRSNWFPSVNAGFMIRGYASRSKQQSTLFTVGVNFSNVNEPNESLRGIGVDFKLPQRTTIHGGLTRQITSMRGIKAPLYISPHFRWDLQANGQLSLQTFGAYILSKAFYSGIFYQNNLRGYRSITGASGSVLTGNTSTLILNAGMDLKMFLDFNKPWRKRSSGFVLGIAYDINLSGLDSSRTLGVMEINLSMNFNQSRKKQCGEFGKFELYNGQCPLRY